MQRARSAQGLLAIALLGAACTGDVRPDAGDDSAVAGSPGGAADTSGAPAPSTAAGGSGTLAAGGSGSGGTRADAIAGSNSPSSSDAVPTAADAGPATEDPTDIANPDAGHDDGHDAPSGPSEGCGKPAADPDALMGFAKHDLTVSGVDPAFISAHVPKSEIAPYTWTHRNYFLRLPAHYDPQRAYPLHFGGSGCGSTDGMSGAGGGLTVLPGDQDSAIQVGLSYVYDGGACFADGYANTPDLPYFDAVLAEVEAQYCVERSQVFVAGFSSGAWEAYMLGCARGGVVRAIATAAGGLRRERPACSSIPAAALLLTGAQDDANPITNVGSDGFDTGSAAARDAVLMLNGCVGTTTEEWPFYPTCQRYTGCPEAYPVIWCTPPGGHMDGGPDYKTAIAGFWSSLPAR